MAAYQIALRPFAQARDILFACHITNGRFTISNKINLAHNNHRRRHGIVDVDNTIKRNRVISPALINWHLHAFYNLNFEAGVTCKLCIRRILVMLL